MNGDRPNQKRQGLISNQICQGIITTNILRINLKLTIKINYAFFWQFHKITEI